MKHAGSDALDTLEDLLDQIRAVDGLKEVKRGVFYKKSKAFLHFHEDPTGMYADLLHEGVRTRLPVTKACDQAACLSELKRRIDTK